MTSALRKFLILIFTPLYCQAVLWVGTGQSEITPPIGTPSAGYSDRNGAGMIGVHDPLLAQALFIDSGEKRIVLCSVDHLGFTYEMVQNVIDKVHAIPDLQDCEVFIGSSHTHSGGGAYLNIEVVGELLAGPYNPVIRQFYEEQTAKAIIEACSHTVMGKFGIGYGKAGELSTFRSSWPKDALPLPNVTVLKITDVDDVPIAVLFNYPVHPTVLNSHNRLFSADFVGYARDALRSALGANIVPIYFNGAQGDINPVIFNEEDRFKACEILGDSLAKSVTEIWEETSTDYDMNISTDKIPYSFVPQQTPQGLLLPLKNYSSELNLILFDHFHAFVTIPGELSSLYDHRFKDLGSKLGFVNVSILGLTNDAHGYIISPEAWRHKTVESGLSFGGEFYGDQFERQVRHLLTNESIYGNH